MSLNDAAAVHQAVNQLAGSTIKTTEQHVNLEHSRFIRDQEDWKRFKTWLLMRNPFEYNDTNLYSLASGFESISGKDEVNCEDAEELDSRIHNTMDGKTVLDAKIRRKDQMKALDALQNTKKIDEVKVHVNFNSVIYKTCSRCQKRRG